MSARGKFPLPRLGRLPKLGRRGALSGLLRALPRRKPFFDGIGAVCPRRFARQRRFLRPNAFLRAWMRGLRF